MACSGGEVPLSFGMKGGDLKSHMKDIMNQQPLVSVIMPVYNASYSVSRAIFSVLEIERSDDVEVIVIDDCSTDDTCEVVRGIQQFHSNLLLFSMPENSGGPSGPRNLGIEKARGEYVTFLDDDDWINPSNMLEMAEFAKEKNHDFVKGYLKVVDRHGAEVVNRHHVKPLNTRESIKQLVANQSTNSDFLVRRTILLSHNLRYPTDIKIGEDSVFTFDILRNCKSVGYIDCYFLYHTISTLDVTNPSSTQRCGDREVNHQITAWERSEEILSTISFSYYDLRLHIGFRNLLLSIVRFSEGISGETYRRLNQFALKTEAQIKKKMNLHKRYEELYKTILAGDYEEYLEAAKCRILIAGYDLKFALPLIPYLSKEYVVRVDEWVDHNTHSKKQSKACVQWADIIWCEWLLGNAVFYSMQKNKNQRLVIRAHGFEIEREFGEHIDFSKVDMIFAVSYYYFELFMNRFSIPREKMRLLPNYVEDSIYSTQKSENFRFHIGLVGILPKRKGLRKALELMIKLRKSDKRFKLYLMGKRPEEVTWICNSSDEVDYYEGCNRFVIENQLTDVVIYEGHKERTELYKDIGYALSLSDYEDRPESFHLAPAEGACSGAMGLILRWPGVEYIYPGDVIVDNLDQMAKQIIKASRDESYFNEKSLALQKYVLERYGVEKFMKTLNNYLKQLFLT